MSVPNLAAISEAPVYVRAPVADLSGVGLAVTMWESVRRRDHHSGALVLTSVGPSELVVSAAPLIVHLLRRAGHHHPADHPADHLDSGPLETWEPLGGSGWASLATEPWFGRDCASGCPPVPACPCDVESSARLLAQIVAGTPAERLLAQVATQFAQDRSRGTLVLSEVNVQSAIVLVETVALLAARRWGGTSDDVLADVRSRLITDQAA